MSRARPTLLLLTLLLAIPLTVCAGVPPLRTVPGVDLVRYAGSWHEIARYPNIFQKGCRDATATYTLRPDGEMTVVNRCLKGAEGKSAEAKGRAWVNEPPDTARLKVTFFWPFRSDYWIIDLGEQYDFAVVGTPDREYLWILSRTPTMTTELYAGILERLRQQGFDPGKLLKNGQ